jgi:hypothetical protein
MLRVIFPLSILYLRSEYLSFISTVIVLIMIGVIAFFGNYYLNNLEFLALLSKIEISRYSDLKYYFRVFCIASFTYMYFCPLEMTSEKKSDQTKK